MTAGVVHIRPGQVGPLVASSDEALVACLRRALQRRLPERVLGLNVTMLDRMIAGGVGKARGYDFRESEHLLAFVLLMFGVAPNFDEQGALARVLRADRSTADKLERLKGRDLDGAWREARRSYDRSAWALAESAA